MSRTRDEGWMWLLCLMAVLWAAACPSASAGNYGGGAADDLAVYDGATGRWYIRNVGGPAIAWNVDWGFPSAIPVAGNYGGDAADDFAVYEPASGNWWIRTLAGPVLLWEFNWAFSEALPVPGDYSGDGESDLAVYRGATGHWWIRTMKGDTLAWRINWGFAGTVAVAGDFDGDGRDDMAVYERATGLWWIRTVGGDVLAWALNWGFDGAKPVPGDFDGDGVGDLAVYHEESGRWWIRTLEGKVLAWSVLWGFAGAVPVPGDFDGDGASDLAVYDAASGRWWIRTLAGGVVAWAQGWGFPGARAVGALVEEVPLGMGKIPGGGILVPAGTFAMGDHFGDGTSYELPVHNVSIASFSMDRHMVPGALWNEVYAWAIANGYQFDNPGHAKQPNHPVQSVSWYDAVKWCNARSQKENKTPAYYTGTTFDGAHVYKTGKVDVLNTWVNWNAGYRLPTEAEWEYAARGGVAGRRFPWGDTISHQNANFRNTGQWPFATGTIGLHPEYNDGVVPRTGPIDHFVPNGFGLLGMAGNVRSWCWDWYDNGYYAVSPASNPRGPASGEHRVARGGGWFTDALECRLSDRYRSYPSDIRNYIIGFRTILPNAAPP